MKKILSFIILMMCGFYGLSQCNNYQIYESFTGSLPTQGGTWTENSMIVVTTPVRTGTHAIGFNGSGDWIRIPQIANPGVLSFWYRRSSNTTAWTLNIQTSPDGTTWTTRGSVTAPTATYQQYSLNIGSLGLTNVFIRLIDARASGTHQRYVEDLSITSTSSSVNTLIPILGACSQTLTSTLTYSLSDDGGPAGPISTGYGNSVDRTITLTPSDNTKKLQLNFSQLDLETSWDYLYIYDGTNTSAPLLATLNGTTIPSAITAENASGQLTIRWTTDGSNVGAWGGFLASITSVTICTTPTNGGTLSSTKTNTTVNDATTLTTSGNGGTITKLEWSYNNFTSVAGSISSPSNPYTFMMNIQQSQIYFRTTSKDGTCPSGNSNIVTVNLNNATPYSSSSGTYGIQDGDHVTNVTLANINNTSTNDGDSYQDFRSQIIEVAKGTQYTLSVTATNTFNPGQGYAAWIDWNGDGVFQTTENVLQSAPANSVSQNITVPIDAITGDVLMRVLSVWNTTPSTNAYSTTAYRWGEIEEYTVRISVELPIELVSFSSTCIGSGSLITWKTSSENNTSHFTLEKSKDGSNWYIINNQQAAGNSNNLITYTFTDEEKNNDINYYRLNQYDIDGTYETFGPISNNCLEESSGYFSIFPNPSTNSFSVIINNSSLIGTCFLYIRDEGGRIVYDKNIEVTQGINLYLIDKLDISPGFYYISVVNSKYTTGILKQIIK